MRDPMPSLTMACGLLLATLVGGWLLGAPIAALILIGFGGVGAIILTAMAVEWPTHEAPTPPALVDAAAAGSIHGHPGFGALIDTLPFPLMLVADARVTAANRAARDLLGDFIVGVDVRSAIRHPAAADRLANPRPSGQGGAIDLIGIGRAGQRWEMRTMPQSDGSRLVSLTDQTGRDAVERMRADFVANASHELRTPLAGILGFIETLSDPEAGGDAALRTRFLGVIDKEARRMLRLVEDLLSISRIEASKAHMPSDAHDFIDIVNDVVAELRQSGDPRTADFAIELMASAPMRADPAQLSQMLHNIIGNAMKYGRPDTPVGIRVAPVGQQMVELVVSDQGEGIPAEQIPRLTERFYRVDSARSRSLGGTGLGLAIVKHVVERHRGRLEIESSEGVGTTLRVRLPLSDPALPPG